MALKLPRTKLLAVVVVVALIAVIAGSVLAQLELQETYVSEDGGFSFSYPSTWSVDDSGSNVVLSGPSGLTITFKEPPAVFVDTPADAALPRILQSVGLRGGELVTTDMARGVGTRPVVQTALTGDEEGQVVYAVKFTGGGTGYAIVEGPIAIFEGTIRAVLASYDSSGTCLVGTAEDRTIQVRVGPGLNRSQIAFLPANTNFVPLGQATDDEGGMWVRLDESAAPGKQANEYWVAVDDVTVVGDCAAIGVLDAPPLVPFAEETPEATAAP